MKITTAKLKKADGSFEYLGIGADANYITLENGENFEEAASEVNNNISNMDLTYQILDEELRTSTPIDVELNRSIAEFSSRDPQTNIIKTNKAKVKNKDGWSEDIPIGAAAVNIDLNNGNNAEDTFENLEVKLNKLNEKYDELKSLVSTIVEGDPVTVDSSGMDYMDTIVYGNSKQKTYEGYNRLDTTKSTTQTINGVTITINENSSITFNGTMTGAIWLELSNKNFNLPSGDYTWSLNPSYKLPSGDYTIGIRTSSNVVKMSCNFSLNVKQQTLSEDIENGFVAVYIGTITTFNNLTIYPMLVRGTYTSETIPSYEPYFGGQPSPNPDYPQYIEVIDGVNLLSDENTFRYTIGPNGEIIQENDRLTSDYIEFKPNKEFYLKCNPSKLPKNLIDFCGVAYYDKNKTYLNRIYKNNVKSITGITPNNTAYIRFFVEVANVKNYKFSDYEFMLVEGATPKPYLPYGYIGLEQSGKNKIGLLTDFIANKSDVTVTIEGQNIILEHQTTTPWAGAIKNITGLPAGETMTISSYVTTSTTTGSSLTIRNSSGDVVKESIRNPSGSNISFSFTVPNDGQISIRLYSGYGDVNVNDNATFSNLQLELGSVATPYEPYHSPKLYPINLNGNSISKVGDIKDLLKIYRNGDVEIEKKIGKVVLNGSEKWHINKNYENVYQFLYYGNVNIDYNSSTSVNTTKCNYFITSKKGDPSTTANENYLWMLPVGRVIIVIQKSIVGTINEFKTWLSEKQPKIYYHLATSQTIQLPSIAPIKPWEGTNIFKLITNLDTTMQVDYYKNYEKYVISNINF